MSIQSNGRIAVNSIYIYKQSQNRVDPDQLASQKAEDLDLHCFQNSKSLLTIVNMAEHFLLPAVYA